ncbi:MarR family transcriptional regulator [Saccharibacillus sp. O16]|nr:MarR family transcriptional regulator [Saccharibacillus sp. O16]
MNKEEQVMLRFREVFNKLTWLNKLKMEAALSEHTPSEVHCMEYIGKHEDANVTRLAENFYMTRSAISKIAKKLMEKGLIESYQKPENKKEIYFKLTPEGLAVSRLHDELHEEFRERDRAVFEPITDQQFDGMLRFIERYSEHLDQEIEKLDESVKPHQA